jgi:hypothetical protein
VSAAPVPDLARLLALLADRALHGLGARDAHELRELLAAYTQLDEDVLERAAAQIDAALAPPADEALPADLRRELLEDLDAFWGGDRDAAEPVAAEPMALADALAAEDAEPPAPGVEPLPAESEAGWAAEAREPARDAHDEPDTPGGALPFPSFGGRLGSDADGIGDGPSLRAAARPLRPARARRRARPSRSLVVAWAAIACLVLAFLVLRLRGTGGEAASALADAPDAVRLEWRAPSGGAARVASGELRWSAERQLGHAVLRGLAPNDPSESRYQLWVVDAERGGQALPSGLFDVARDAEQVEVELRPALRVGSARRFVVSLERPDGVLVSRFDKAVAVAGAEDPAPPPVAAKPPPVAKPPAAAKPAVAPKPPAAARPRAAAKPSRESARRR